MSVIDLITRVDAICKKNDKNDFDKQKEVNISGDDAFARLYAVVNGALDEVLQVLPISLYTYTFSRVWSSDYLCFVLYIYIYICRNQRQQRRRRTERRWWL